MRTRVAIGALGLAMGAFGALRFLQLDVADILNAVLWLAGGVLVHDALIAPLTIALAFLAARVLPVRARAGVAVGFIVIATVTITAVPVLAKLGERPDNPTLLDRNYLAGWLVFVVLVVAVIALSGPVSARLRRGRGERVSRSAG